MTSAGHTRGGRARLFAVAGTAAALALVVAMFALTAVWVQWRFVYPIDYGEGVLLDQTVRMAAGGNIYPPSLTAPPYLVTNYPPLFIALQVPFAWLFGAAYWYGRLISQTSAVAAAIFLALTAGALTRDRLAAVIAGATLLGIPLVGLWANVNRVDLLALALGWAALFVIVRRPDRTASIAAGALLIAAAGFTRQTSWFPPMTAACCYLVSSGRSRAAARLVAAAVSAGVVTFGILQWLTGGFFLHVVAAHGDAWSTASLIRGWRHAAGEMRSVLPLAVATLAYGLWKREWWAPFAGGYFAAGALVGLAIAKDGAYWNYFIELGAGCALLAGLAYAAASSRAPARTVVLLAIAAQALWSAYLYKHFVPPRTPDLPAVVEEMRRTPDPILADSAIGLLPLAGRQVYFEPSKMSALARNGRWDERPLLDDLAHHRIALIVLLETPYGRMPNQWTPRILDAIERHYRRCGRIADGAGNEHLLYRPRCGSDRP